MNSCLSGLRAAVSENKKLVRSHPAHSFPLSSLSCVFEEVIQCNTNGNPFFLKDLVMLDVKVRDWKVMLPRRILPVYDVLANPDAQILSHLAKFNVGFYCETVKDLEMLSTLVPLAKSFTHFRYDSQVESRGNLASLPNYVIVSTEEQIRLLAPNTPVLLELRSSYSGSGFSIVQISPALHLLKILRKEVVGFSLPELSSFSEKSVRDAFVLARTAFLEARSMGCDASILHVPTEVKTSVECQSIFEERTKILTTLSNEILNDDLSNVVIRIHASTYFAEACKFLFTKVDSKFVSESGDIGYHISWPFSTAIPHHISPVPCSPDHSRRRKSSAKFVYEAASLESACRMVRVC